MVTEGAAYEVTACFILVLVGSCVFFAHTGSLRCLLWMVVVGVLTMAVCLGNSVAYSPNFPLGKFYLYLNLLT